MTDPARRRWKWLGITYAALAGVFGLFSAGFGILLIGPYPWQSPDPNLPWITRWHAAESAVGLGIFSGLLLLATLWRPQHRVALIQVFAWTITGAIVVALLRTPALGFDPGAWVQFALIGVLIAIYPRRGDLFSLKGEATASKPLLALTMVAFVLLFADGWRNFLWQLSGFGGDPARRFFWLESIFLIVTLVLAGLLVSIKRPGWGVLGVLLGIAYIYLGVVAITLPSEIGSWGPIGGILSIVGGSGYLAMTLWEAKVRGTNEVRVAD